MCVCVCVYLCCVCVAVGLTERCVIVSLCGGRRYWGIDLCDSFYGRCAWSSHISVASVANFIMSWSEVSHVAVTHIFTLQVTFQSGDKFMLWHWPPPCKSLGVCLCVSVCVTATDRRTIYFSLVLIWWKGDKHSHQGSCSCSSCSKLWFIGLSTIRVNTECLDMIVLKLTQRLLGAPLCCEAPSHLELKCSSGCRKKEAGLVITCCCCCPTVHHLNGCFTGEALCRRGRSPPLCLISVVRGVLDLITTLCGDFTSQTDTG